EDTPTSTNALRSLGIHDDIVADVVMLTKPSGMTNKEYRQRVVLEGSLRAIIVKLADLADSVDNRRPWVAPPDMRQQYLQFKEEITARLIIMAETGPPEFGTMYAELALKGLVEPR